MVPARALAAPGDSAQAAHPPTPSLGLANFQAKAPLALSRLSSMSASCSGRPDASDPVSPRRPRRTSRAGPRIGRSSSLPRHRKPASRTYCSVCITKTIQIWAPAKSPSADGARRSLDCAPASPMSRYCAIHHRWKVSTGRCWRKSQGSSRSVRRTGWRAGPGCAWMTWTLSRARPGPTPTCRRRVSGRRATRIRHDPLPINRQTDQPYPTSVSFSRSSPSARPWPSCLLLWRRDTPTPA